MFLVLLMAAFIGALQSNEYYKKDCAENKFILECTLIQGKEFCKKIIKPECESYEAGDYNYYKEEVK